MWVERGHEARLVSAAIQIVVSLGSYTSGWDDPESWDDYVSAVRESLEVADAEIEVESVDYDEITISIEGDGLSAADEDEIEADVRDQIDKTREKFNAGDFS